MFECIHPSSKIFEKWVFPSVVIDFNNAKSDSTDDVP